VSENIQQGPLQYRFAEFLVDVGARALFHGSERLAITARVFDTMVLLLERAGTVVEREEFFRRVWQETAVEDGNLSQAIFVLRKLLADPDQRIIVTLPGRGYMFTAPVETIPTPVKQESSTATVSSSIANPSAWRFRNLPLIPAVVLGVVLLALATVFVAMRISGIRSPAPPQTTQTVRFRVPIPETLHLSRSGGFSLSPDGTTLAYLAAGADGVLRVWVQSLSSLEPKLLPGTEVLGGDPPPFWSADSKFVAFYSGEKLKKTDLKGNPPQTICSVPGILIGGFWSREGVIVFGRNTGGLMRVAANGGDPVPLTIRDASRGERVHGGPTFLPDGRHFLYSRFSSVLENNGVYVGSLDAKPEQQGLTQVLATPFGVQFLASAGGNGKLLFLREGPESALWSQEFDTSRLALMGEPALLLSHVGHNPAFGFFAASADALVYRNAPGEAIAQMVWFDRHGERTASFGESAILYSQPVLSPDGSRVAMAKAAGGNVDVWVYDVLRNVNQRLTSDPALDDSPVWSQDGNRIAFASSRTGHYDLYQIAAGGGREELLYSSGENKFPTSWSPDGRYLLYGVQARETNGDIWVLQLDGRSMRSPVPLVHTRANEGGAAFSPDARWIAYVSDESGIAEVYVQPFLMPSASGDSPPESKVLVSRKGGRRPRWRADGMELFYSAPDGAVMSVAVTAGAAFRPRTPQLLFRTPSAWFSEASAASDGTRFLVAVPVEQTTPEPFTVVLNWRAEFAGKK
jgi:Tol biopolymer transport system component/DNA-binding winged helix-turn-helix (wHTH) protein